MKSIEIMKLMILVGPIVGGVIGYTIALYFRKHSDRRKLDEAVRGAEKVLEGAKRKGEREKQKIVIAGKEQIYAEKEKIEIEFREQRQELTKTENRLNQREANVNKKSDMMLAREKKVAEREKTIERRAVDLDKQAEDVATAKEEQVYKLQVISGYSREEAKKELFRSLEKEARYDAAVLVKEIKDEATATATREAKRIVTNAIERCAGSHSAETTVSVVQLPDEKLKGKIIGREGKNIRAFEEATGVQLVVDDTPEAVLISAFDPIRREVARVALQELIASSRIVPDRIEAVVVKAKVHMEEEVLKAGEGALKELGIKNMNKKLVQLLGRLKYRSSYGQNVLNHSIEVAFLTYAMAKQLRIDARFAKRAGLLHDIGKAVDRGVEGTHTEIGVKIAQGFNEHPLVLNSIAAHHEDVPATSLLSVLVSAADAISGARPGARRESLEGYIKRLEKLEGLSESFDGVDKAFAIKAGREIRVMVENDKVDDAHAMVLANEIAKKIEAEAEYPGKIKVTVIREFRAVEHAR
jgi:ribonuclease Y